MFAHLWRWFGWDAGPAYTGTSDGAVVVAEVVSTGYGRVARAGGRVPQVRVGERLLHLPPGSRVPAETVGLACRIAGTVTYRTSPHLPPVTIDLAVGMVRRLRPVTILWDETTAYVLAVVADRDGM